MRTRILEAQEAIRLITEALEAFDLDSLAAEASRIAVDGPVVVVHDGSDVDEYGNLEEAFANEQINTSSDVYKNGDEVGRVEEGKIIGICQNCGCDLKDGICSDTVCPFANQSQPQD